MRKHLHEESPVDFSNSAVAIMLRHSVHTFMLIFLLAASYVKCRRVIRAVEHAEKSGCYIVKLRSDTTHEVFERTLEGALNRSDDFKVYAQSEGLFKFFTVRLPETALDEVRFNCTFQFIAHFNITFIAILYLH